MAEIFTIGFVSNFKILLTAILIYALVYSVLQLVKPLGDSKGVKSLIALLTAIIVSFSGVVTYAITYALNWFIIIMFFVFLLLVILMFLGVDFKDISKVSTDKAKFIIIAFVILFIVIFIKSFFSVNNSFETSNLENLNKSYIVDTSYNDGITDIGQNSNNTSFLDKFNFSSDLVSAALFLLAIGIFVMILGRG